MPQHPASEIHMQTMFVCIPLRLGILCSASLQFVVSLLFVCRHAAFAPLIRPFTGGYALSSSWAIASVEASGVLFGPVGIVGAWQTKTRYLSTYNFWQMARLLVWVIVLCNDIPLLLACEDWVNNVKGTMQRDGWNQLVFDVAVSNQCASERTRFLILSSTTALVFAYLVWATSRYIEFLGREPKHLLRVPKDLSSGIFFARPLIDRSYFDRAEEYGTFGHQFNASEDFL